MFGFKHQQDNISSKFETVYVDSDMELREMGNTMF